MYLTFFTLSLKEHQILKYLYYTTPTFTCVYRYCTTTVHTLLLFKLFQPIVQDASHQFAPDAPHCEDPSDSALVFRTVPAE